MLCFRNAIQNVVSGGWQHPHRSARDGRFYARIAVPRELVPFGGRSGLIELLGSDRRGTLRLHPAAVARLQSRMTKAASEAAQAGATNQVPGRFAWLDK